MNILVHSRISISVSVYHWFRSSLLCSFVQQGTYVHQRQRHLGEDHQYRCLPQTRRYLDIDVDFPLYLEFPMRLKCLFLFQYFVLVADPQVLFV